MCGRARANVKLVESTTKTAIYFPNLFPNVYGYHPETTGKRHPDQIYITGAIESEVLRAEAMLIELVSSRVGSLSSAIILTHILSCLPYRFIPNLFQLLCSRQITLSSRG